MKIGIMTFQKADNYGAMLQCYALFHYLKKDGINVEVIDYRNKYIERNYRGMPNIRKNLYVWIKEAGKRILDRKDRKDRQKCFDEMRIMLSLSNTLYKHDIKKGLYNYDMIITGSDQVWNPKVTGGLDDIYFLNFAGEFEKIAYAVSLGNVNQDEYKTDFFSKQIRDFKGLSFRERDAVEFITNQYNIYAKHCVDPVFLLRREQWEKFSELSSVTINEPYLLVYFLENNPDIIRMAELLSRRYGLKIICCNKNKGVEESVTWINSIGPIDFVKLIKQAKIVITSSFHATAFSVIFQKKVFMLLHSNTGSRVKTLAKIVGIEKQIFESYEDFEWRGVVNETISFDLVSLDKHVCSSKNYIDKVIVGAGRNSDAK